MTTTIVRQLDLEALQLASGGHAAPPDDNDPGELCLLEACAWMAGEAKGPWPGDPDYIARDRSDLAGTAPAEDPAEVPAPKKARANKRNALAAVPAE